jgi:hypothetical protein
MQYINAGSETANFLEAPGRNSNPLEVVTPDAPTYTVIELVDGACTTTPVIAVTDDATGSAVPVGTVLTVGEINASVVVDPDIPELGREIDNLPAWSRRGISI